ncbi:MFS family permease [Nakamurella sp. UYEF19]|uniref:MFS transporter n=1 Tax=Nakamurella sp. UYEF19 TaxID=1756392 RepID=UPI0033919339
MSPATDSRTRSAHASGFWVVALAFTAGMAFSTVPTPLYSLYQERDGFSTAVITVIFACYAIGVLVSLFLAGHVSDWLGRRRLLMAGLLVETISGVLFLVWTALPGLLLARVICGIGVGLITATATAHLGELDAAARPGASRTRADLVATAANLGGLSLGPLIAGALAQYVASPLEIPYWVFIVLMAAAIVGLLTVPETVAIHHRTYRPQHVSVPPDSRRQYFDAAAVAFVAFAVMGLFTGLAASFVAGTVHQTSHLMAGLPAFLVFFCAAAAQILLGRREPSNLFVIGLPLLAVGLVVVTVGVWVPSLALFLLGGALSGAGVGLLFKGAMSSAAGLAAPEARGEAAAGIFLAAYVGLTVPVVLVGVATRLVTLPSAMTGFAIAIMLACGAMGLRLRQSRSVAALV